MMREGPYPQGPRENRNARNDRADYVLLVCRTDGTCVPRSVGSWLHHRFPQLLIVPALLSLHPLFEFLQQRVAVEQPAKDLPAGV